MHLAIGVDAPAQPVHQVEGWPIHNLDAPVALVADPGGPQAAWAIGRRIEDKLPEFGIGRPSMGGHEALRDRFSTHCAVGVYEKYDHVL
jgi:hypothetical protein